jgi:hypothetical protein
MRVRVFGAFCFGCLILSPWLQLALQAQAEARENVLDAIQCSIKVETEIWSQGKPILVVVRLTNASSKEVDLLGIYTFELAGARQVPYWSPVNIRNGTPLELEYEVDGNGGGRVPKRVIHLGPGETKAMRFDISNLLWNTTHSSRWPYQKLFEVAPKGNCNLTFKVETDHRRADNTTDVTHIVSNSVRILIE